MNLDFLSPDDRRIFDISRALRDWFISQEIDKVDSIFAMNALTALVVIENSETLADAIVKLDAIHDAMVANMNAKFDRIKKKKGTSYGHH